MLKIIPCTYKLTRTLHFGLNFSVLWLSVYTVFCQLQNMIFLSKIENEIKLKLLNLFASLEDKPQQKDQNEHNMNNSSLEETIE
jgi:hypothetical protein